MSNFCIVCEFNPLHNGHKYLIDKARALGADNVVCVMSGNSTQRGELAITDKYLRAQAAIKSGADLVLELPFPWSASSAEFFATAAIYIASGFCDKIIFGSECGDIALLQKAAQVCESAEFHSEYLCRTANGEGSASAFIKCLADYNVKELSSNDLLGVAYIRAVKRLSLDMGCITVARKGAAYNSFSIVEGKNQSATAIRSMISADKAQEVSCYMPEAMAEILYEEQRQGRITDMSEADGAVLGFFRLSDVKSFDKIADADGGIANRLVWAANESVTAKQMIEKVKTKRYTDAKLRRAMLFCITGTELCDIQALPEYTTLLAANEKGRALIAENRRNVKIKVVTKPADAPQTRQTELSRKLDAFYGLARKNKLTSDYYIKKSAYIEK